MTITLKEGKEKKELSYFIKQLNTHKVGKVGWFKNIKYPNPTYNYVAEIAAQNEYGNTSLHIPPRPFMRPTIEKNQNKWLEIIEKGCQKVLDGKKSLNTVMETVGLKAAADIRKTIAEITQPPLSQTTIKYRLEKRANKKYVGNLYKPLIDTGYMYESLTYKVENK